MLRMRRFLVACVLVVGCSRASAPSAKPDSQFEARWLEATRASDPAYIESARGEVLLAKMRRAIDPPRRGATAGDIVKGPLSDPEVVSVIRRNLAAVKGCYEIEERAGTVGSGKAILSLEIVPAGTVQQVSVDAPAFAASNLPACIRARARAWTFPRFTQGPKRFSYPLVFVGG